MKRIACILLVVAGMFGMSQAAVPAGSPDDAPPVREARTSQGNPLPIFAPAQAGDYEIRYKMRDTGEVAAAIPLAVE